MDERVRNEVFAAQECEVRALQRLQGNLLDVGFLCSDKASKSKVLCLSTDGKGLTVCPKSTATNVLALRLNSPSSTNSTRGLRYRLQVGTLPTAASTDVTWLQQYVSVSDNNRVVLVPSPNDDDRHYWMVANDGLWNISQPQNAPQRYSYPTMSLAPGEGANAPLVVKYTPDQGSSHPKPYSCSLFPT
jgi:hypothetical protein